MKSWVQTLRVNNRLWRLWNGGWLFWLVLWLTACTGGADELATPVLIMPTTIGSGNGELVLPTLAATPEGVLPVPTITLPGDTAVLSQTTPLPTPTLQPTITPAPATGGVTPAGATLVNTLPLPTLPHDLLFIGDGALKRWRRDGQLETLLPGSGLPTDTAVSPHDGDMTTFILAADGRFLITARISSRQPLSNTTRYTYDLLRLNLDNGESRTLTQGLWQIGDLALSTNGQTLAYTAETNSSTPNQPTGTAVILDATTGQIKLSATCHPLCQNLAWHPDQQNIVWRDNDGLWLYNLTARTPQLLLPNTATALYYPIAWANNGRYLLLWRGTGSEGAERVVLDVPTNQIMLLPDSFVYAGPHTVEAVWMDDSRLLVSRPQEDTVGLRPPLVEVWRISPEEGRLVRDAADTLPVSAAITAPQHLADGRFTFALYHPTNPDLGGLYILVGFGDKLERVNALWPTPSGSNLQITWASDASAALILDQTNGPFYAPTGDPHLYHLPTILGRHPHTFTWHN